LGHGYKSNFVPIEAIDLQIVSNSNLTNCIELRNELGVLASEASETTDEKLIVLAFRKWGEQCVDHLNGDFSFAIWNQKDQQLFCARDHLGSSPFFFFEDRAGFVFSTEPNGIFRFGAVQRKFNKSKLGILLFQEPHSYLTEESWFSGVRALPAGTTLSIDEKGIREHRYWKPHKKPKFKFRDEREVFENFRELLIATMSARLAGSVPPASLLSGGLDSSSIVALSAKLLKAQNKTLDVFSAVIDSDVSSEYPDERYFIDQFKSVAGVSINYVSAGGLGPFSNLSELFEKHDSPFVTSRHYLYRSLMAAAQEKGARTLFDGSYGEFGATNHTFGGFAEMFAGLNWLTLFRELRQRSRQYNESFMYNLRANTISPNIPRFLVDLRRRAKSGSQRLNQFSFLDPHFSEQLLANCKYEDPGFSGELPDHNQNQVNSLEFLQSKMSDMVSRTFDNSAIELRYPLLDKRIIEFNLSVPLRLKMRDGFYRYLIRASLDGILPEKIQWRTSKTSFSPDYRRRFRIQIGDVRDLLREVRSGDPIREFIDIDKLIRWSDLDYFDDSVYQQNEIIARDHLPQAIYLIYFLRTFSAFRN
jgi:asparagine synthase (glutamine-hydrolysing)